MPMKVDHLPQNVEYTAGETLPTTVLFDEKEID